MLIEFRVANFRSFGEEQVLSLVASKDTAHQGNLIPGERFNLLKAAGLFGANASGKSNLVRAMGFMAWLVRNSATKMNIGDEIDVVPFRLTAASEERPSRFEVVLHLDGVRYDYGFSATRQRVCEEWLTAYPQKRPQRWLQRRLDPEKGETKWTFRGPLKGNAGELLRARTRDNGLVLSRGAELNVAEVTPVFQWFRADLSVLDLSTENVPTLVERAVESCVKSSESWARGMRLLRDADMGIDEVRVVRVEDIPPEQRPVLVTFEPSDALARMGPSEFRVRASVVSALREGVIRSQSPQGIQSAHRVPGTAEEREFDFLEAESNGTQRFFGLAGVWLSALDKGTAVFVDELDCSLHPLLTRKLLQFFQDPRENTRGAQLVFVTHDSTLMDLSLLRRDQIWLVEKDAGHASRLFSLYDFDEKPRKAEAVEKRYLAGRYGGVPMFGPTLENLESP